MYILGMAHIHCWNFYTESDTRTHIYRFDTMHKSPGGGFFSPVVPVAGSERRGVQPITLLPRRGRLTPHRRVSHSAMDEHDTAAAAAAAEARGLGRTPSRSLHHIQQELGDWYWDGRLRYLWWNLTFYGHFGDVLSWFVDNRVEWGQLSHLLGKLTMFITVESC